MTLQLTSAAIAACFGDEKARAQFRTLQDQLTAQVGGRTDEAAADPRGRPDARKRVLREWTSALVAAGGKVSS